MGCLLQQKPRTTIVNNKHYKAHDDVIHITSLYDSNNDFIGIFITKRSCTEYFRLNHNLLLFDRVNQLFTLWRSRQQVAKMTNITRTNTIFSPRLQVEKPTRFQDNLSTISLESSYCFVALECGASTLLPACTCSINWWMTTTIGMFISSHNGNIVRSLKYIYTITNTWMIQSWGFYPKLATSSNAKWSSFETISTLKFNKYTPLW